MAILATPKVPPYQAKRAAAFIRNRTAGLFHQMKAVYETNAADILRDSAGLDPAAIVAELGKDGAELLRLMGIVRDALNAATPGSAADLFSGKLAANPNGTVSVK